MLLVLLFYVNCNTVGARDEIFIALNDEFEK
jgi:hypothetical protein